MANKIEIIDHIADVLPAETVQWFHESELATDPTTAEVVEYLGTLFYAPGDLLEGFVEFSLAGAYFHRATEIATVDGEPIADPGDIPGGLHSMELAVIRGYPTSADLKEHCTCGEERIGAAILNMATRWASGKEGYQWSFDVVEKFFGNGTYVPPQLTLLEEIQESCVGAAFHNS